MLRFVAGQGTRIPKLVHSSSTGCATRLPFISRIMAGRIRSKSCVTRSRRMHALLNFNYKLWLSYEVIQQSFWFISRENTLRKETQDKGAWMIDTRRESWMRGRRFRPHVEVKEVSEINIDRFPTSSKKRWPCESSTSNKSTTMSWT